MLIGGGLLVAQQLLPVWPRETDLELDLGQRHREVVEVRLAYLRDGEPLKGVRLHYDDGAPSHVRHRVTLPSGELELQCELLGRDGHAATLTRTLRTPTEGLLRVAVAPNWQGGEGTSDAEQKP